MKLIVTGGGTGGHIYPAIAIADKFKSEDPGTEVLYVGCREGIEQELVPKAGYDLKLVDARWVDRSSIRELFKTANTVLKGISQSRKIIREFKPDAVIGTGGYVCFPVIYAAQKEGVPAFLHEQNAFPGLANRKLEKFVRKIFLGFGDAKKYFREPEKMVEAGNPVRKSFFSLEKSEARKKLGFGEDEFIVLSFGGSLGAETINEVAFSLMKKLNGVPDTQLIFGTGKRYFENVNKRVSDEGITVESNIHIKDYINDMDNHLMAADVVIARSGALSVAEITVCGKASVLIPSPNVTGNHQFYNAKAIADRGGAFLIEEKALDAEKLVENILELKNDPEKLRSMGASAYACAPVKALDIIYDGVIEEIRK